MSKMSGTDVKKLKNLKVEKVAGINKERWSNLENEKEIPLKGMPGWPDFPDKICVIFSLSHAS